ncbi:MAG TPA: amidohydrolase family protein [Acidimicrobiales bacterium]|nr:amidohydrolase family protein [Acidimicrobiales bacterium]
MTYQLRGGTLIDGTGADPRADASLVLEGDRIATVESGSLNGKARGEVIDLDGLTLLPGLIDAHSHFGLVSMTDDRSPPAVTAARIFRNCELALDAGFTTVRDVGGIDGGVAQAVALGLIPGPRIFPSGPLLCQTGGHGDESSPFAADHHGHSHGIPGLVIAADPCDGPDQVRLAARNAFRRGATQIKVCVSGGAVSFTDRLEDAQFTVEELKAAVAEADARDTYVTAHAHNVRGIRNGLAAGIECFEHGTFLDEETATAMAAAGAYLVPTFAVLRIFREMAKDWGVPDEIIPRIDGLEEAMAASLKLARDAGVVIGAGSDILGPEQNRRGLELAIRADLGGAMEAIVASTAINARILRQADDIGTVETGKRADLIAIDGDPLNDANVFDDPARVVLVIKDGQVVKDIR